MGTTELRVIVEPFIIKGKVHCVSCGRYVNGKTCVQRRVERLAVCNVRCGIDYIGKVS
ncbi:hypothetical protein LCGC14_2360080 [marine sediment metagenome]|uniref:Uncharacterized protein n=1 Tax=marine sediment metagenome TaxID=412755 RepID=A0A0F9C735_9ZZZZ